jgi:hypothetical protein
MRRTRPDAGGQILRVCLLRVPRRCFGVSVEGIGRTSFAPCRLGLFGCGRRAALGPTTTNKRGFGRCPRGESPYGGNPEEPRKLRPGRGRTSTSPRYFCTSSYKPTARRARDRGRREAPLGSRPTRGRDQPSHIVSGYRTEQAPMSLVRAGQADDPSASYSARCSITMSGIRTKSPMRLVSVMNPRYP